MLFRFAALVLGFLLGTACSVETGELSIATRSGELPYVRVSERDPRYFELEDGRPFIPIGLNIAYPRFLVDEEPVLAQAEERFQKLSANGGNLVRVWMGHPFYDLEHEYAGKCDSIKARRMDRLFSLARKYDIRLKVTFDHFLTLEESPPDIPGDAPMGKSVYHVSRGGPAKDMTEFFTLEESKIRYKRKLRWIARKYRDERSVFAWELWNEIDKTRGDGWREWTAEMLGEMQEIFPNHMCVQSLGHYDHIRKARLFASIWNLPENDFAQIHRYLDLGTDLEASQGPIDIMAADAVRLALNADTGKPVLLAETGAVEPGDSGPSHLLENDRLGTILHDVVFAPFFAGAAGTGQSWHWYSYVEKLDLWHHFGAFAEVVEGIDPPAERFEPMMLDHDRLRVYALAGENTFLLWLRDAEADWRTEFEGSGARPVQNATIDLSSVAGRLPSRNVRLYNPWSQQWTETTIAGDELALPTFLRSLVVRIDTP